MAWPRRLDRDRFDYLFVLVGDGRRWFIPAGRVDGGSGLRLGGPKYAEFEVERGDPIPGCTALEARLYNRLLMPLGGMSEWLKETRL